jgi:hypothetical protein
LAGNKNALGMTNLSTEHVLTISNKDDGGKGDDDDDNARSADI